MIDGCTAAVDRSGCRLLNIDCFPTAVETQRADRRDHLVGQMSAAVAEQMQYSRHFDEQDDIAVATHLPFRQLKVSLPTDLGNCKRHAAIRGQTHLRKHILIMRKEKHIAISRDDSCALCYESMIGHYEKRIAKATFGLHTYPIGHVACCRSGA